MQRLRFRLVEARGSIRVTLHTNHIQNNSLIYFLDLNLLGFVLLLLLLL